MFMPGIALSVAQSAQGVFGIDDALLATTALQGVGGLVGLLTNRPSAAERRYGASAAGLESRLMSNVTRRLAGQPSGVAQELARQAEAGQIRQVEMAKAQLARSAQTRGIGGTGVALAQERLAGQEGIRAASATRRGIELADIRGAEGQGLSLAQVYQAQANAEQARRTARDTAWIQLLGSGANVLGQMAGMKYYSKMYGGQPSGAEAGAGTGTATIWPPGTALGTPQVQMPPGRLFGTPSAPLPEPMPDFTWSPYHVPGPNIPTPHVAPTPGFRQARAPMRTPAGIVMPYQNVADWWGFLHRTYPY